MPLFEYRCPACESQFELLIRGAAVPACPTCGSTSIEKLLSMFAVTSDGTQLRNRQTLGAQQRARSANVQKEKEHFRHDHHDD
jgi:putative FmdB family regulatory protein